MSVGTEWTIEKSQGTEISPVAYSLNAKAKIWYQIVSQALPSHVTENKQADCIDLNLRRHQNRRKG